MLGLSLITLMRVAKEHNVAIDICYDTDLEAWRIMLRSKHQAITLAVSDISVMSLNDNAGVIENEFLDKLQKMCIYKANKAERCVCCGEIIPEGRMFCPKCIQSIPPVSIKPKED